MKVEINEKPVAAKIEYPCLMRCDTGAVVLFSEYECGAVVHHGGPHNVGYYSCSWNMDAFNPFTGSVTLSND